MRFKVEGHSSSFIFQIMQFVFKNFLFRFNLYAIKGTYFKNTFWWVLTNLYIHLKCATIIIHLEPDILDCEVKWALGSITMNKASGSNGIPVELVQILKNNAVKVLHSICQQIWKTQQWPQDWKWSVFIPIPGKGNAKECSNYCTIALISHAS